eukprot:14756691-Heterocapsa_arctica.AAC.1
MHPSGCVRDARVDDVASRRSATQEVVAAYLVAGAACTQGLSPWRGQLSCRGCRGRRDAAGSARVAWVGGVAVPVTCGGDSVRVPGFPRVGEAGRM